MNRYEYRRPQMGTLFRLILYAPDEAAARKAAEAAFQRIETLEAILSDYRSDSELARLCRLGHHQPQVVSRDLFHVLERSLYFSELSNGAFDITVKPLVRLWQTAGKTHRWPDPVALRRARAKVGYRHVILNPRIRSLRLELSGMELDLGAIGKGFAADEALRLLRQAGIRRALIDAGGDLRLGDAPPGSRGWTVRIEDPKNGAQPGHLILHDCAIATSSGGYRFVELGGLRLSHILDPHTGRGIRQGGVVSVLAPDCLTADALSTTVSVLGPEKGMDLIHRIDGVEARIQVRTNGKTLTTVSDGFPSPSQPWPIATPEP
ncbi:MAG: FAD:protein FMN transferase [Acidobacteriota bacterium]